MKQIKRLFGLTPLVFLISLLITVPVLAFPPLPSSFYGTVKVNGANVPDGTVVQAVIGESVFAEGFTQTFQGGSVYVLDVPGDETDTATLDGGKSGDSVRFKIGGILAEQFGTWQSGTNVNLDLTATSSQQVQPPQPTPTPVATQTAIVISQPTIVPTDMPTDAAQAVSSQLSPVPTTGEETAAVPAVETEVSDAANQKNQSLGDGPVSLLPSPTLAGAVPEVEGGSGSVMTVVIVSSVLIGAAAVGYRIWPALMKK